MPEYIPYVFSMHVYGATKLTDEYCTYDQIIKEMTGGHGADYCFECIGSVSVMAEAFESSRSVRMHDSLVCY